MKLKIFAITAVLAAGASGAAMAQYYAPSYSCPAGYAYYSGACQRTGYSGYYSNPVSGAVSGEESGAASGYATGGPVGAVVGGALGAAAGTVTGATNTAVGVVNGPGGGCPYGYYYANGYCYPNR